MKNLKMKERRMELGLRQAELAKPPGSLGKLEDAAVRLAGITGKLKNEMAKRGAAATTPPPRS